MFALPLLLIGLAWTDDLTKFEAASIHPVAPGQSDTRSSRISGGPGTSDPGRFICQNCRLRRLVLTAYRIPKEQLAGPDWLGTQSVDVTAKVPAGASRDDFRTMLQNLLAERFDCLARWETQQRAIYRLVVSKRGGKFKDAAPAVPLVNGSPDQLKLGTDGYPDLTNQSVRSAMIGGRIRLRLLNATMADLVAELQAQPQFAAPILDATGLAGRYDLNLFWTANDATAEAVGGRIEQESIEGPNLFQALEDQLGLRLESAKGPVKMLVIEHMSKLPTAN